MMLDSSVTYRQQFFDYISSYLVELKHHAYLYALTFGYRNGLTADDWLILRDSGLAHLMAISGLHIGLAMLWGWGIGWFLRSLLPQNQKFLWLRFLLTNSTSFIDVFDCWGAAVCKANVA